MVATVGGGLGLFHTPTAISAEPEPAPPNTLGIRNIMFAIDDIDDVVARLQAHGGELVGEVAQFDDRAPLSGGLVQTQVACIMVQRTSPGRHL